jgi:hypothetical protein
VQQQRGEHVLVDGDPGDAEDPARVKASQRPCDRISKSLLFGKICVPNVCKKDQFLYIFVKY